MQKAPRWSAIAQPYDVPITGEPTAVAASPAHFDIPASSQSLREGIDALSPLLGELMTPKTLSALQVAARSPDARIDEALWVSTVYELVASTARGALAVDQIVQALRPIYLGRLATMLQDLARSRAAPGEDPHLKLRLEFERRKTELVAAWPAVNAR